MNFEINEKVIRLSNMLCEIDSLYQTLLINKGLSDSEYVVMFAILSLGEGCLQKDICEISHINKKTINSTIKKLEREGIIRLKAGKYPNLHIYLTKEGTAFIEEKILPVVNVVNTVLNSFPESEFETLTKSYSKYIEGFKEQVKNFRTK